jgi:hypothetical protein
MCAILLLHHYQARKHGIAVCCLIKLSLLAMSVLVFLANGASAQLQETISPILSSGLRDAAAAQTPVIEKSRPGGATQSLFDAANLLPIESIGPGSDIRPFLDPAVPSDVRRAALRRAWATDPAIRDFVGLSENFWDFDALDGVPGSGPPITGDARRLMAGEAENPVLGASDKTAPGPNKSGR